ncbi:hypothetical protein IWW57_003076 [Coemansia sp. S610]|nr:hypothetical protein IWW57_003076 [Coemansia sp. S610]
MFHCVYRRWQRNEASTLTVQPHQFRIHTEQLKPHQVFSENELALFPIKVLTTKEICDSAPVAACHSHRASMDAEYDSPQIRFFSPNCYICLADYKVLDMARILDCGHYFHQPCIDDWLTNHNINCPVCKTDMVVAMNLPPRTPAVVKPQQLPPLSYEPLSSIRPPPRAAIVARDTRVS